MGHFRAMFDRHNMVGNASAYWSRRRNESLQLSHSDRLEILAAYQRLQHNVAATARARKVSRKTVDRVVRDHALTGTAASLRRHNSGRPRTATSPVIQAKVAAAMTAPTDGEYVPSASAVNRKLKLGVSDDSVRRAARNAGLRFGRKCRQTALSETSKRRRLQWARAMIRNRHDWRVTVNTDEKLFVLEDRQVRCWMPRQQCQGCVTSFSIPSK